MSDTGIEWTDKVWNPVTGCSKISPGCQNCYAARMAPRLAGRHGYPKDNPFAVVTHVKKLRIPMTWRRPKRIFVNSMSDLFHDEVPDKFIKTVFAVMRTCSRHTFQILTKRPERMYEFLSRNGCNIESQKPLPNIWLGVSVENQEAADKRIPFLLKTPASIRFISCEPLLGPIDINSDLSLRWSGKPLLQSLNWVIAGGESGPGARPMNPKWVRSLRDQCKAARVPFFFKQFGEWKQCDYEGKDFGARYIDSQCIDGQLWDLDHCDENGILLSTGDNPTCPKCKGNGFLRLGKKKLGNKLDGKVYNEFPVI